MKLHFFPALAPLTGVLPWLLTAVGLAASGARALTHSKNRLRALGAAAALCLAAGAALAASGPLRAWLASRSSLVAEKDLPRIESLSAAQAPVSPEAASPGRDDLFAEAYSVIPTRAPLSAATLAPGLLLYTSRDGTLEAHEARSGRARWRLALGEPAIAAPLVHEGRAYVANGLHASAVSTLLALELASGKVLWQRRFAGHLETPPAIDPAGSLLYQGAGPGGLWAIDRRSGDAAWSRPLGHVDSTPVRSGSRLYVPAQPSDAKPESKLFALDAARLIKS